MTTVRQYIMGPQQFEATLVKSQKLKPSDKIPPLDDLAMEVFHEKQKRSKVAVGKYIGFISIEYTLEWETLRVFRNGRGVIKTEQLDEGNDPYGFRFYLSHRTPDPKNGGRPRTSFAEL